MTKPRDGRPGRDHRRHTVAGLVFDVWFPINKNLWTSSYVLFTAGLALLLLAPAYYLVDMKHRDGWSRPFAIFGTNAIVVFFGSTLMAKIWGHADNCHPKPMTFPPGSLPPDRPL